LASALDPAHFSDGGIILIPPNPPLEKGGNYRELLVKSPFEKGGISKCKGFMANAITWRFGGPGPIDRKKIVNYDQAAGLLD
jgi:hypothetical protein